MSVKKRLIAVKRQMKRVKTTWWGAGLLLLSPSLWADIPTPPSDFQITSSQSYFKALANLITEDVLPLAIPGVLIVLGIYVAYGLLSAMQESKKSGDWGAFKTHVVYSAIAIVIAGALGYYLYDLANGITVQT